MSDSGAWARPGRRVTSPAVFAGRVYRDALRDKPICWFSRDGLQYDPVGRDHSGTDAPGVWFPGRRVIRKTSQVSKTCEVWALGTGAPVT